MLRQPRSDALLEAASRRLVEKLGFHCEGLLRDNLRAGDDWRDDMLYALLATERGRDAGSIKSFC